MHKAAFGSDKKKLFQALWKTSPEINWEILCGTVMSHHKNPPLPLRVNCGELSSRLHRACFPFERPRSRGLDRRPGRTQMGSSTMTETVAFQQSYWLLRCHGPLKVPAPLQWGTSVAASRSVHGSDSAPQSSPSVRAAKAAQMPWRLHFFLRLPDRNRGYTKKSKLKGCLLLLPLGELCWFFSSFFSISFRRRFSRGRQGWENNWAAAFRLKLN